MNVPFAILRCIIILWQYIKYLPDWNRHVALELYYEGSDFLYGALFRICFPYYSVSHQNHWDNTTTNVPDRTPNTQQAAKNVVSFVFLSVPDSLDDTETEPTNHVDDENERIQKNIDTGIKCLRQLLPLSDDPNTCQIVVLASQPIVVERITQWITSSKRQCTVLLSSSLTIPIASSSNTTTTTRSGTMEDGERTTVADDGDHENDKSKKNAIEHSRTTTFQRRSGATFDRTLTKIGILPNGSVTKINSTKA